MKIPRLFRHQPAQFNPGYLRPVAADDGWLCAAAEAVGLSVPRLAALTQVLHAGEMAKFNSVLIARHGQLVYEAYSPSVTPYHLVVAVPRCASQ